MEWYLKVMRDNYANFNGRARRKEYWMFTLFFSLIFFSVLSLALAAILLIDEEAGFILFLIVTMLLYFIHLVPAIAVTVRRLHDIGKSGWFYLLAFIPYVGGFILFIFSVMDGDKGANDYGPDPKFSENVKVEGLIEEVKEAKLEEEKELEDSKEEAHEANLKEVEKKIQNIEDAIADLKKDLKKDPKSSKLSE